MSVSGDTVEVELRVGMLDMALAKLMTEDHHTIEFPTILLPESVQAGSIVRLQCTRALEAEAADKEKFESVQQEILDTFATNLPRPPVLRARNITQTSVVLEWDPIDTATAELHFMALYKGKHRLGLIPQPLKRTVTKVSNLEIDAPYDFHLVLSTSAGDFESNTLELQTHKMTDLSGVVICLGTLIESAITKEEIEETLERLGCKPPQDTVKLDTTHFICNREGGAAFDRAAELNIPIVTPEWLKECEKQRRLVSVRGFYLSANPAAYTSGRNAPSAEESQNPSGSDSHVINKEETQANIQEAPIHPSEPNNEEEIAAAPEETQTESHQENETRKESQGEVVYKEETQADAAEADIQQENAEEEGVEQGKEVQPKDDDNSYEASSNGITVQHKEATEADIQEEEVQEADADAAVSNVVHKEETQADVQEAKIQHPEDSELVHDQAGTSEVEENPEHSVEKSSLNDAGDTSHERTDHVLSSGSQDELSAALNNVCDEKEAERLRSAAGEEINTVASDDQLAYDNSSVPGTAVATPVPEPADISIERELEKELESASTAELKEGEEQRVVVESTEPVEPQSADVGEASAASSGGEESPDKTEKKPKKQKKNKKNKRK